MTKNAAVLRMLDRWRAEDGELAEYIAAALAAERRATVERIRERAALKTQGKGMDPLGGHVGAYELRAILDEEAAR